MEWYQGHSRHPFQTVHGVCELMIEALDLLLKVLDSNLLFHHGNLESWDCNSVPLLVNPELCNWNFNSALEVDIHKLI